MKKKKEEEKTGKEKQVPESAQRERSDHGLPKKTPPGRGSSSDVSPAANE